MCWIFEIWSYDLSYVTFIKISDDRLLRQCAVRAPILLNWLIIGDNWLNEEAGILNEVSFNSEFSTLLSSCWVTWKEIKIRLGKLISCKCWWRGDMARECENEAIDLEVDLEVVVEVGPFKKNWLWSSIKWESGSIYRWQNDKQIESNWWIN